jgi:hypothetical protein
MTMTRKRRKQRRRKKKSLSVVNIVRPDVIHPDGDPSAKTKTEETGKKSQKEVKQRRERQGQRDT